MKALTGSLKGQLTVDIIDSVTNISNLSVDMKYHQRKLREQEMTAVIEKLNSIESSFADMKTLLSDKGSTDSALNETRMERR